MNVGGGKLYQTTILLYNAVEGRHPSLALSTLLILSFFCPSHSPFLPHPSPLPFSLPLSFFARNDPLNLDISFYSALCILEH